jgi:hypothetical protein
MEGYIWTHENAVYLEDRLRVNNSFVKENSSSAFDRYDIHIVVRSQVLKDGLRSDLSIARLQHIVKEVIVIIQLHKWAFDSLVEGAVAFMLAFVGQGDDFFAAFRLEAAVDHCSPHELLEF